MPRTVFRHNKMLFGPVAESDLAVIGREPVFADHGLCAQATPQGVQVFVTLPGERAAKVQEWFLRNHQVLNGGSN